MTFNVSKYRKQIATKLNLKANSKSIVLFFLLSFERKSMMGKHKIKTRCFSSKDNDVWEAENVETVPSCLMVLK